MSGQKGAKGKEAEEEWEEDGPGSLPQAISKPLPVHTAVHLHNNKLSGLLARLPKYKAQLPIYRFEASKHSGIQGVQLSYTSNINLKRQMKINISRISTFMIPS